MSREPTKQIFTCENQRQICYGNEWSAPLTKEGKLEEPDDASCPDCGEKGMARERV